LKASQHGFAAQGDNEMSTAPKTVVETHSAIIVNVSNTDFVVQGSGLTMTFIGGSNDVVSFPQGSNDRLIAVSTTNLGVNASTANGLGVVVAGSVIGMHVDGWGDFASGQTLTLVDQGHYTVSISANTDTALISGLDGGPSQHSGSIAFSDSVLHASQIAAINLPLFG
jgi:hypothetical protein